jgi:hypothetical protein
MSQFNILVRKIIVWKTLLLNRWSLILLKQSLHRYRKYSKPMVDMLPADNRWISGIDGEETHLDNTQRIIERRLTAASRHKKR